MYRFDGLKELAAHYTHTRRPDKSFIKRLKAVDPNLEVHWNNLKRCFVLFKIIPTFSMRIPFIDLQYQDGTPMPLGGWLIRAIGAAQQPFRSHTAAQAGRAKVAQHTAAEAAAKRAWDDDMDYRRKWLHRWLRKQAEHEIRRFERAGEHENASVVNLQRA